MFFHTAGFSAPPDCFGAAALAFFHSERRAPPDITSMKKVGACRRGRRQRISDIQECPQAGPSLRVLLVEDDVNQGVDIGDVHLVVTVHIGSSRGLLFQNQSDEGIDIGDVHLAVTVHITLQLCFDFNPA